MVDPQNILNATCIRYGITREMLLGRARYTTEARFAAAYLLSRLSGLSMVAIGKLLGGRDHTTICYSVERATLRVQENGKFREAVDAIEYLARGTSGKIAAPEPAKKPREIASRNPVDDPPEVKAMRADVERGTKKFLRAVRNLAMENA